MDNVHPDVVDDFGREWSAYDQTDVSQIELKRYFDEYFINFPWDQIGPDAKGFDLGCGSGRWAKFVADRVGQLHLIDPSSRALRVAQNNVRASNCYFHLADVGHIPGDNYDFGYSLGVLHHAPQTSAGIAKCVEKLKPGAPFLIYLYYRFDNKPFWYKWIWLATNPFRWAISHLPFGLKHLITNLIALVIYWPLARLSRWLPFLPLSYYKDASFYIMRNDALDRFGTKVEKRFTKDEIYSMMTEAGLERIVFNSPYWTAIGFKSSPETSS